MTKSKGNRHFFSHTIFFGIKSNKQNLRTLIKKGKLEEAIESLLIFDIEVDKKNEILLLSSRLKRLEEKERKGLLSHENATTQETKITHDLLRFVGLLKEKAPVDLAIQEEKQSILDENTPNLAEFPKKTTFWIKPIGLVDDPVPEGKKFELIDSLNFLRKPSVKIGDIIICYGVGIQQILSIYQAVELPKHQSAEALEKEPWKKRWPWYVMGENLTLNFGKSWWKHNLSPFDLGRTFKVKYPAIPFTQNGNDALRGLNFGSDKLKLRREFAEFVIKEVAALNTRCTK